MFRTTRSAGAYRGGGGCAPVRLAVMLVPVSLTGQLHPSLRDRPRLHSARRAPLAPRPPERSRLRDAPSPSHRPAPRPTRLRDQRRGDIRQGAPAIPASLNYRPELRSEEHTSELQSLMRISYAVFCLKKKKKTDKTTN